MIVSLDFAQPWVLLLLPLAALPLLRGRREALRFSSLEWLPPDRAGTIIGLLWRALAVLAIFAIVLALAGPGQPETTVMRNGRGAEILVLMDRSRSMDLRMLPPDWRTLDPVIMTQQAWSRGPQKSQVARDLLAKFVAQRVDDRFALMFFSASPILVVPFTQRDEVVQAGISAGGVGRGLSETDVGAALLAAIGEFDQRSYSGSRIILLVSDGGAQLDAETRQRIQAGLLRNHIGLYWLYLRSINSPESRRAGRQRGHPGNCPAPILPGTAYTLPGLPGRGARRSGQGRGGCRAAAEFSSRLCRTDSAAGLQSGLHGDRCLGLSDVAALPCRAIAELVMKRYRAHWAFAVTALGFGLAAAFQLWQLDAAGQINAALAGNAITPSAATAPEAQLARALVLARAGDYDNALKGYKLLVQGERADLKKLAQYNLGNLHLRQALKRGAENLAESLPLIELAKQSYRDLLRDDPDDWDARYNLERALWLAPEVDETPTDDATPPPPSERAVTTMQGERRDLP